MVCLAPQLFLLVYLHTNVGPPTPPAATLPAPVLQLPPCCESSSPHCPSPPFLPAWMIVSSSTPWLSDFHTVQFSGSSGYFLFLNLLLTFFWLCKEVQCVYLCLHLGRKSQFFKHIILGRILDIFNFHLLVKIL